MQFLTLQKLTSKELLESNNLLAGWSGFEPRSTPLQSKKITVGGRERVGGEQRVGREWAGGG